MTTTLTAHTAHTEDVTRLLAAAGIPATVTEYTACVVYRVLAAVPPAHRADATTVLRNAGYHAELFMTRRGLHIAVLPREGTLW